MSTTSIENVLIRIANVTGFEPRLGWNGWAARCPAHEDRKASLSIGRSDDGRVLIHCHAGCTTDAVLQAIGLTFRDLGGELRASVPISHTVPHGTQESQTSKHKEPIMQTFREAQAAISMLTATHGEVTNRYEYKDATGNVVGYVLRWDAGDGSKTFRPVSRRGDEWTIAAMATPRPLYGLTDIIRTPLGAERVFLVEGEKACDVARSLGLLATTTAGGSAAPHHTDLTPLAGRSVVILPDNDAAGEKYALCVAESLLKLSPTPIVRIVKLPGLPPAGDLVEFLAANDTLPRDQLVPAIESLVNAVLPITAHDLMREGLAKKTSAPAIATETSSESQPPHDAASCGRCRKQVES